VQEKAKGTAQKLDVAQLMTLNEKLKIISTLAKSEVASLPDKDLLALL